MSACVGPVELSVVIVAYNTASVIDACLQSILREEEIGLEIYVVDNASSDDGAAIVRTRYPAVRLIANEANRGFAAANNQALPYCSGRYILFLNPDTILYPGTLRTLISFMDGNPRVGLAGPVLRNPDGSLQQSVSFKYPGHNYARRELAGLPGKVACVMGACQIVRSNLIRAVGGFDEDFFLYGEDEDLCLRIRKEGYEIACVKAATVLHYGGYSERTSAPEEFWSRRVHAEYLFFRKHYQPATIRRIARVHLLRSTWRAVWLAAVHPLSRDKKVIAWKRAKYRAAGEAARRFLAGL